MTTGQACHPIYPEHDLSWYLEGEYLPCYLEQAVPGRLENGRGLEAAMARSDQAGLRAWLSQIEAAPQCA